MTKIDITTRRVRNALASHGETKDAAISVAGEGGLITLSGKVASQEVKEAAERVASQQEGVVEVINDIVIQKDDIVERLNLPTAVPPQQFQ
jgi:osmotically-inducible protein OsmY